MILYQHNYIWFESQYCFSPNNIIMMIGLASQLEGILAAKKEG
jgi:hypothetical protein